MTSSQLRKLTDHLGMELTQEQVHSHTLLLHEGALYLPAFIASCNLAASMELELICLFPQ